MNLEGEIAICAGLMTRGFVNYHKVLKYCLFLDESITFFKTKQHQQKKEEKMQSSRTTQTDPMPIHSHV